jgi:Na+-transporting methylmalonyl-CoA/oxaloacetate decarboxylase gamma subunit
MDKINFALQVTILGIFVVMATLFLLYSILLLFNRFFSPPAQKSGLSPPAERQKGPAEKEKPSAGPITAAVMAAVYRYMQLEGIDGQLSNLRISVQPSQPSGSVSIMNWRMAGRKELLENRIKLEQSRRNKKHENF